MFKSKYYSMTIYIGTAAERGLSHMHGDDSKGTSEDAEQEPWEDAARESRIYGFPLCQSRLQKKASCLKYVPFCPTYGMETPKDKDSISSVDIHVFSSANQIVQNEVTEHAHSENTPM